MVRHVFAEVAHHASKRVPCAGGCGRTLKRTRKFWQTLNPFNKMPDGSVKTEAQIRKQLGEEAQVWQAAAETCTHCSTRRS